MSVPQSSPVQPEFPKAATGIQGLDEITKGGLPRGRPTLVCGGAGCGKTLLAVEFLVHGAADLGEPGVFMSFEETTEELAQNVRSIGFDLDDLIARNLLVTDYVHVERSEIEETGEYDLEGLFIRLGFAIDAVGARRVVLDSLETLFGGLSDDAVLRAELRRLFRWLKDRGVTTIVTGERGERTITRHGLEEYVSDCVIVLDHRVDGQLSTRRLRIVKYRGSAHGTNEYPFLIDEDGLSVLPVTSLTLDQPASAERISTGIEGLDRMLSGGVHRGSSVLVSGTAGTGKTSTACHFADAACRRGERCLFLSFEESESQIVRNMRSVGLDLRPWIDRGLLVVHSTRPSSGGLEMHLATLHKLVRRVQPHLVIVDPVTAFFRTGTAAETDEMLVRLIDFLKSQGITALLTTLTRGGAALESSQASISSLIDTWILLRDIELGGERNRGLYVLKARGTAHSNQIREFLLSDQGVHLQQVYIGPEGVLTGSMRLAQEERERASAVALEQEIERRQRELERKRRLIESQIAAQRAAFEAEQEDLSALIAEQRTALEARQRARAAMARSRKVETRSSPGESADGRS